MCQRMSDAGPLCHPHSANNQSKCPPRCSASSPAASWLLATFLPVTLLTLLHLCFLFLITQRKAQRSPEKHLNVILLAPVKILLTADKDSDQ